jgi:hypothetical protein
MAGSSARGHRRCRRSNGSGWGHYHHRPYELLAFGAKIVRRAGQEQIGSVVVTEPIEGTVAVIAEPGLLGGTSRVVLQRGSDPGSYR